MKNQILPPSGPKVFYIPLERRKFLKAIAAASAGFALPGYLAEALTLTPSLTQGPYYPLVGNMPLDKDNDLIYLNDNLTRAVGKITYLTGRILDSSGNPIKGALVEIWHADNGGNYIYSATSARNAAADSNFQGFGQFLTGADGQYKFRTVKAGLYTGRTRHFHFAVTIPGQYGRYCTQLFWNETAYVTDSSGNNTSTVWSLQNSADSIFTSLTSAQQAAVNLTYTTVDAATGAVAANFDFVSGLAPVDPSYPNGGSLIVAGAPVAGTNRFMISVPAYTNYAYEVYGNPSLLNAGSGVTNWTTPDLTNKFGWAALPFSLTPTGTINTNKYLATNNGTLNLYLQQKATNGFYFVAFRIPGSTNGP